MTMVRLRPKNIKTVDALVLENGDFVVIKGENPVRIPKADILKEFDVVPVEG